MTEDVLRFGEDLSRVALNLTSGNQLVGISLFGTPIKASSDHRIRSVLVAVGFGLHGGVTIWVGQLWVVVAVSRDGLGSPGWSPVVVVSVIASLLLVLLSGIGFCCSPWLARWFICVCLRF